MAASVELDGRLQLHDRGDVAVRLRALELLHGHVQIVDVRLNSPNNKTKYTHMYICTISEQAHRKTNMRKKMEPSTKALLLNTVIIHHLSTSTMFVQIKKIKVT